MTVPPYSALASHWRLERGITFLNHGSFGACPIDVLAAQQGWQRLMEDQPVAFLQRELEPLMDDARVALGEFVGADSVDLGFVPNATTGVNAVVRSLRFEAGDEILTTDHAYNACKNALEWVGCGTRHRWWWLRSRLSAQPRTRSSTQSLPVSRTGLDWRWWTT